MSYTVRLRLLGRIVLGGLLSFAATSAIAADRPMVVASPQGITRSVVVHTSDLDLTSGYGRERLDWRVEQAARTACNMFRGSDLDKLPEAKTCLVQARASAFAQLEARGVAPRLALNSAR